MERIREVAIACVGRAVMFGSLAIGCVMISLSFSPAVAFRSGALMTLGMSAILIWKAVSAAHQNPKGTEVWLYLDEPNRPSGDHARYVFATVLREVYARFAQASLAVSCAFFAASVMLNLLGFPS